MKDIELLKQIDFKKGDGLVPAIVQDVKSRKVLMMGYMSKESYRQSLESGKLCFYSRSKKRLWTKGEESGNFLYLKNIRLDCDRDTLLFSVEAAGPVCHTGSDTCWKEDNQSDQLAFLHQLEQVIAERKKNQSEKSYTASLFQKGINKIAQKVGEEAVELVIESKDENKDLFLGEAADLLFHYLVLLQAKGVELYDVLEVLEKRHGGEK